MSCDSLELDGATRALLEECFKKEFIYPNVNSLDLSQVTVQNVLFTSSSWTDPELENLKKSLNNKKSELSHQEIREWHAHTTQMHPGGLVSGHMRKNFNAELCTQAWCKFREIVHRLDLMEHLQEGKLHSIHLCEAPGAFITSFNHYLRNKGFVNYWMWLGTTLNPYYEGNSQASMIDDDNFIGKTLDHWYFGHDNTGDIMNRENILGLVDIYHDSGGVHLVTADGSIDCADNPSEQESITSALHYSEIVTALHLLQPGGHFVLKMFTLFEDCSIGMMYLLRSCFHKLSVLKPVTSKPGNSEVYIIAQQFKGLPDAPLETLLNHIDSATNQAKCILPRYLISDQFLDAHRKCCQLFCQYQMEAITRNLHLSGCEDGEELQQIQALRECCLMEYIKKYKVKPINQSEWITSASNQPKRKRSKTGRPTHRHTGSFVARQQRRNLDWKQRLLQMDTFSDDSRRRLLWLQSGVNLAEEDVGTWRPVRGKPFSLILSSRFCDNSLLETYNDVLKNAEFLKRGRLEEEYARFDHDSMEMINKLIGHKSRNMAKIRLKNRDQLSDVLLADSNMDCAEAIQKKSRLLTVDCYSPSVTESEWLTTVHTLCILIQLLNPKMLKNGDSLVISVPPLVTRISATLCFVCQQYFTKVTVMVPEHVEFPVCYLVATGYRSTTGPFDLYLTTIQTGCSSDSVAITTCCQQQDISDRLLEIIPGHYLYETQLCQFLRDNNEMFIKRRLNFIIEKERQFLEVGNQ